MKLYELTIEISSNLSDDELKTLTEKISGFVTDHGGKLEKIIEPSRKRLGYVIKKNKDAYISVLFITIEPEKLVQLEKILKIEPGIIRCMILAKKHIEEPLRPIMRRERRLEQPVPEKTEELNAEEKEEIKTSKPKKVELGEIDQKIEEILSE